jgi:hypothetical protein
MTCAIVCVERLNDLVPRLNLYQFTGLEVERLLGGLLELPSMKGNPPAASQQPVGLGGWCSVAGSSVSG